jgi:hypothetical protein
VSIFLANIVSSAHLQLIIYTQGRPLFHFYTKITLKKIASWPSFWLLGRLLELSLMYTSTDCTILNVMFGLVGFAQQTDNSQQ